MTSKRSKFGYALMALLFLAIVGAIGWLAVILFHLRIDPDAEPLPGASPAAPLHRPTPGPVSETVVYAEDAKPAEPDVFSGDSPVSDPLPGNGHIPCICEGGEPQIHDRDAFPNPLTHQSVVTPARVQIKLTIPEPPKEASAPTP